MWWPVSQVTIVNVMTSLVNVFYPTDFSPEIIVHSNINIIEKRMTVMSFEFSSESMEMARALARNQFSYNFLLGAGSSAYQVEGAYNSPGKGLSAWDFWSHTDASPVVDKSNGDIACDSFHRYAEDIRLVQDLGANTYRISLSWSRILPHGLSNFVSLQGIKYYNEMINSMILGGITPMITIHHYDIPEKLQLMGGWTNPQMVDYFEDYVRTVFTYFGDRVKYWITINDPFELCNMQFGDAYKPLFNDSAVGNYLCGHHVLLAHARAYQVYRNEFLWLQRGKVGISIGTRWFEPKDPTLIDDIVAADVSFQFANYWFLNPLLDEVGGYPDVMQTEIEIKSALQRFQKSRLPIFTLEQRQMIKESLDFLGINFFTTYYVQAAHDDSEIEYHYDSVVRNQSIWNDMSAKWLPYDKAPGASEVKNTPKNFRKLLQRLNSKYILPQIYITANGFADYGELYDVDRALYFVDHLFELLEAMKHGVDVRGYIAWSLLDGFEWNDGYTKKFGLYSVDFYDDARPRSEKFSTEILKNIYKAKSVDKIITEVMKS